MEKMTYRELTTIIAQLNARMNEIDMYLTGVVAILGKEEILQAAKDYAAEQTHKVEETLKAQVESGVAAGWLKPTTVSGLKSLVVGYETVAGRPAVRMQVIPEGMPPVDRGNYIGRTTGEEFIVQTPAGPVTTKITEVYEIDEERRREVIAEHQKAIESAAKPTPPADVPADPTPPNEAPTAPPEKVDDIV